MVGRTEKGGIQMLYKNVKVLDIGPVIYLGKKAKDWKYNELYVKKELMKVEQKYEGYWGIESPIDDMVLIYLPYQRNRDKETYEAKVDVDYLINAYEILKEVFDDVQINFYLDHDIEGIGNSFDMSIEEFKQYNQIQKNENREV